MQSFIILKHHFNNLLLLLLSGDAEDGTFDENDDKISIGIKAVTTSWINLTGLGRLSNLSKPPMALLSRQSPISVAVHCGPGALYGVAYNTMSIGTDARLVFVEGVTVLPPGSRWLTLALRCLGKNVSNFNGKSAAAVAYGDSDDDDIEDDYLADMKRRKDKKSAKSSNKSKGGGGGVNSSNNNNNNSSNQEIDVDRSLSPLDLEKCTQIHELFQRISLGPVMKAPAVIEVISTLFKDWIGDSKPDEMIDIDSITTFTKKNRSIKASTSSSKFEETAQTAVVAKSSMKQIKPSSVTIKKIQSGKSASSSSSIKAAAITDILNKKSILKKNISLQQENLQQPQQPQQQQKKNQQSSVGTNKDKMTMKTSIETPSKIESLRLSLNQLSVSQEQLQASLTQQPPTAASARSNLSQSQSASSTPKSKQSITSSKGVNSVVNNSETHYDYNCDYCDLGFASAVHLYRHMTSTHTGGSASSGGSGGSGTSAAVPKVAVEAMSPNSNKNAKLAAATATKLATSSLSSLSPSPVISVFICDICCRIFKLQEGLNEHRMVVHNIPTVTNNATSNSSAVSKNASVASVANTNQNNKATLSAKKVEISKNNTTSKTAANEYHNNNNDNDEEDIDGDDDDCENDSSPMLCSLFNSTSGCNALKCTRIHVHPEKNSRQWLKLRKQFKSLTRRSNYAHLKPLPQLGF